MSQSQQTPQVQIIYFVLDVLRITGQHLSMTILQHFLHLRRLILLRLTQVTGFGNIVLQIVTYHMTIFVKLDQLTIAHPDSTSQCIAFAAL